MGDEIINDYRNGFYYYEGEIMNPDRNESPYITDPNKMRAGYSYYIDVNKSGVSNKVRVECVSTSSELDEYVMLIKHSDLPYGLDLGIRNGNQLVQFKFNYSQLKELLSIENK